MKKIVFIILSLMFAAPESSANSLDELYRDLIRADNEGYLPLFVKNRKVPDILSDDKIPTAPQPVASTPAPNDVPQEVSFVDPRQKEAEAAKAEALAWENAIKAIQENRVTPVELEEIIKRVEQNNPRAVEIYAWMLTKGVGVKQNLIKAFQLYQQAAKLGVLNAENNAAQIYRVLSPDERAYLAKNS